MNIDRCRTSRDGSGMRVYKVFLLYIVCILSRTSQSCCIFEYMTTFMQIIRLQLVRKCDLCIIRYGNLQFSRSRIQAELRSILDSLRLEVVTVTDKCCAFRNRICQFQILSFIQRQRIWINYDLILDDIMFVIRNRFQ